MGSIDIPDFLKGKMKEKIASKKSVPENTDDENSIDLPDFLKKKDGTERSGIPFVTEDISPSLSRLESSAENDYSFNPDDNIFDRSKPVTAPLPTKEEGFKEFEGFGVRKKKATPKQKEEIEKINNFSYAIQNGTVDYNKHIAPIINDNAGKAVIGNFLKEYSDPEILPKDENLLLTPGQQWDSAIKNSKLKNVGNGVAAADSYAENLDKDINSIIGNTQREITTKSYASSMTPGTGTSYKADFDTFDPNDDKSYEALIDQLRETSTILNKDGKPSGIKVADLIDKLNTRKFLLLAKRGLTPLEQKAYPEFDDQKNEDYYKVKIEDAVSTFVKKSKLFEDEKNVEKQNKLLKSAAENFRFGLEDLKTSNRGDYNNVLVALRDKSTVAEGDFEHISEMGQAIKNKNLFFNQPNNPDLIGAESDIKYFGKSYESKKSIAAGKMGEWLKSNGFTNQSEFTALQMKKAAKATGLTDPEILRDIIFTEKLIGVDAIPKSGFLPSFIDRGFNVPFVSIVNTLANTGDTQAETYLKSNSLSNTGLGTDKIITGTGERLEKLPSEKDNVFYGAIEGLGQFVSQVALTGGIGGSIRAIGGGIAKGLVGEGVTSALISAEDAAAAAMFTGTFMSSYLQEFDSSYADALNKTGDVKTAKLMGSANAFVAAAFEELLPDAKIWGKMVEGFSHGGYAKGLIDLIKKGGDPNEIMKKGVSMFTKFSAETGNVIVQENAEEVGTRLVGHLVELYASPNTAKNVKLGDEILDTIKATTIQTLLPGIFAGGGAAMQKDFTQKTLHDSALNLEKYRKAFDELLSGKHITQDEYNKVISLMQTHRNSLHEIPELNIHGDEIATDDLLNYAIQQTSIKINNERLKKDGISAPEKADLERKIKDAEAIQEKIYNKKTASNERKNDQASTNGQANQTSQANQTGNANQNGQAQGQNGDVELNRKLDLEEIDSKISALNPSDATYKQQKGKLEQDRMDINDYYDNYNPIVPVPDSKSAKPTRAGSSVQNGEVSDAEQDAAAEVANKRARQLAAKNNPALQTVESTTDALKKVKPDILLQSMVQSGEIKYLDEEGKPCAAKGMYIGGSFGKFGDWRIVKDLKGAPSHDYDGVDLNIKGNTVNAEGGELVLRNKGNDYAIIPKDSRKEVMGMIADNCYGCLNSFIDKLPKNPDVAEDGGLYDGTALSSVVNAPLPGAGTPLPDPDPTKTKAKPTRVVWDADKELLDNGGKPMAHSLNSLPSLSKQAALAIGVDPSMLLASAWVEGGNKQARSNMTSPAFNKAFPDGELFDNFPVDGFTAYGIDTIGDKWDKVKKYLPEGFDKRLKFYPNTNELGQKVTSAGFDSNQAALMAKAAMLKYEEERVTEYAKKKGVQLDDNAKKYFTMMSYNRGNAFGPIDEYAADLDKKTFISGGRTSKKEAHANVLKRIKSMETAKKLIESAGDVVDE